MKELIISVDLDLHELAVLSDLIDELPLALYPAEDQIKLMALKEKIENKARILLLEEQNLLTRGNQ
jgi:hypothetical protein